MNVIPPAACTTTTNDDIPSSLPPEPISQKTPTAITDQNYLEDLKDLDWDFVRVADTNEKKETLPTIPTRIKVENEHSIEDIPYEVESDYKPTETTSVDVDVSDGGNGIKIIDSASDSEYNNEYEYTDDADEGQIDLDGLHVSSDDSYPDSISLTFSLSDTTVNTTLANDDEDEDEGEDVESNTNDNNTINSEDSNDYTESTTPQVNNDPLPGRKKVLTTTYKNTFSTFPITTKLTGLLIILIVIQTTSYLLNTTVLNYRVAELESEVSMLRELNVQAQVIIGGYDQEEENLFRFESVGDLDVLDIGVNEGDVEGVISREVDTLVLSDTTTPRANRYHSNSMIAWNDNFDANANDRVETGKLFTSTANHKDYSLIKHSNKYISLSLSISPKSFKDSAEKGMKVVTDEVNEVGSLFQKNAHVVSKQIAVLVSEVAKQITIVGSNVGNSFVNDGEVIGEVDVSTSTSLTPFDPIGLYSLKSMLTNANANSQQKSTNNENTTFDPIGFNTLAQIATQFFDFDVDTILYDSYESESKFDSDYERVEVDLIPTTEEDLVGGIDKMEKADKNGATDKGVKVKSVFQRVSHRF